MGRGVGRVRGGHRDTAVKRAAHRSLALREKDVLVTKRRKPKIVRTRVADDNNVVHTVIGGNGTYRRTPCSECPWRVDRTGTFPAEAFRISAHTAYDASMETFGCHMSGQEKPATCAGFLLRNADHNVKVRLAVAFGKMDLSTVEDGGLLLHASYRAMAVANGVDPPDPVIAPCRANGYDDPDWEPLMP